MPTPLLPEFLGIMGIDMFLVLSILTCIFDFPAFVQYVYHISAFIGLGQLWINYAFAFGEETRFLICIGYLIIGLANIVFINGYIGARDRRTLWTISLLCFVTIPSVLLSFSAISTYVNKVAISLPLIPVIPFEAVAVILVICGIVFAASFVLTTFRPKSNSSIRKSKEKEVKSK